MFSAIKIQVVLKACSAGQEECFLLLALVDILSTGNPSTGKNSSLINSCRAHIVKSFYTYFTFRILINYDYDPMFQNSTKEEYAFHYV